LRPLLFVQCFSAFIPVGGLEEGEDIYEEARGRVDHAAGNVDVAALDVEHEPVVLAEPRVLAVGHIKQLLEVVPRHGQVTVFVPRNKLAITLGSDESASIGKELLLVVVLGLHEGLECLDDGGLAPSLRELLPAIFALLVRVRAAWARGTLLGVLYGFEDRS